MYFHAGINKMIRLIVLLAIATLCVNCRDMETKKVSSEAFLEEELREIDMSRVDEYPTFESCDSLKDKEQRYRCFQEGLLRNFQQQLQDKVLIVDQEIRDTVWVFMSVSLEGELVVEKTEIPAAVSEQIPEMEVWLTQSLDSLPAVYPAIKRGIPVKTRFKMPVVINVE